MIQRLRRFLRFLYCLLFALSLLGCAAPLTLESLSALNHRAYAGGICGVPQGTPANTHFYAINIAMGKVVTDRNPAALRRFMPNADSVHEVRSWAPLSSAKTVPIALGVTCPARKELPTDLFVDRLSASRSTLVRKTVDKGFALSTVSLYPVDDGAAAPNPARFEN